MEPQPNNSHPPEREALLPTDSQTPLPPPFPSDTQNDLLHSSISRFSYLLLFFLPPLFALFQIHYRNTTQTKQSLPENSTDSVAPTILISIDAFRFDYLSRKKHAPDGTARFLAPTLNEIAAAGAFAADGMQPVMPTKTFPNHWSIATGLYPENHGIVGNVMYDPLTKKWFHLNVESPDWWHGAPIWQTIRETPRRVRSSNGTLLTMPFNYTSACVFWPGSTVRKYSADAFWDYDGSTPYEARVSRVVSLLNGSAEDLGRPAQFVTLYFESVDSTGHMYGPNSPEVDEQIEKVDSAVASLLKQLGPRYAERYNIIVVSDHGMTETSVDRSVDILPMLKLGSVQDIVTSPVGLFMNISVSSEELYTKLEAGLRNETKHVSVYRKENIPKRWYLRNSRLITDVITVAKVGWSVVYPHQHLVPDSNKWAAPAGDLPHILKGNHGFDNIAKDMQATFLAQGPAFRNKSTVSRLRAIDVYEMICFIFSANPAPNNGSLEVTKSSVLR